jgi:hypothetical protein
VRSPYLFPAYGLGPAIQIARRVESDGGGTLSEEALADAIGLSVKSSTFRLRTLTPRQFGLLDKAGPHLTTTPLAKAVFKPMSDEERADALWRAFLHIPVFREITQRYQDTNKPQGGAIRNVLERELGVQHGRVADAERVLMDSAREAGALRWSGADIYLGPPSNPSAPTVPAKPSHSVVYGAASDGGGLQAGVAPVEAVHPSSTGQYSVTDVDLALLDDKEFHSLWTVLGKIVRSRGRRQLDAEDGNEGKKGDSQRASSDKAQRAGALNRLKR